MLDLLGHVIIMALAPGPEEISGLGPAAVDFFPGDQVFNEREGIGRIGHKGCRLIGRHGLGEIALADIDASRNHAAIAGRSAKARLIGIKHKAIQAKGCKFQRRRQSRIARADNDHPRLTGQGNFGQGSWACGPPTKRAGP